MKFSFLVGTACIVFGAVLFLTAPFVALSDTGPKVGEAVNSEFDRFLAIRDARDDQETESDLVFCPPTIYTDPGIELRNGFFGFGLMVVGASIIGAREHRKPLTRSDVVTGFESD